jgi:uncharacterized protein (DUF2141 family)
MMDFLKICCLVFMSFSMQLNAQLNFDLTVNVTGLENNDGVLQFGLYNNPDQFPIVGETLKMVRVKTTSTSRKYTFKNLPKGNYAVAIYQDENNNDNCDKNFLGVPIEPYAFSNDIRPKLSAPSFKDCSFMLDKSKTVKIKLVY